MSTALRINGDQLVRHDRIDHAEGDRMRRAQRDGKKDLGGNSPFNEAFSFTEAEYQLLRRLKPHLFDTDLDPKTRRDHWVAFGNSAEGKAFRVR